METPKHDYLSIFLFINSDNPDIKVKAKFQVALFGKNSDDYTSKSSSNTFHNKNGWGWDRFIKKIELKNDDNKFLPNNVLTLLCHFETFTSTDPEFQIVHLNVIEDESIPKKKRKLENNKVDIFGNHLQTMFEDKSFSDMILIVDNQELKVNKCVLAAASPIFCSIFKKDQCGKSRSSLTIFDMSYDVINELIRFIYTKKIEFLHDIAHELISAAHKYGINDLKELCEESLCKNINVDNALKLLHIADLNNARYLKEFTSNFIIKHRKHFIDNCEFKEMMETNPRLLQPLFFSIVNFYHI